MKNKEKETAAASAGHRALTALGAVLCVILIPILIVNCTLIVKSFVNKDQVPSFGGRFPMIILSDSMYPEFQYGDLIVCKSADPADIKVGDIICFYDPEGNGTTTVTHRVTEITTDDTGALAWQTKGDANNAEDAVLVPAADLVGIYTTHFAGVGNIAMFMQTTKGLMICVVCPIILLVAYDVIRRRIYESAKKKDTEALMAELSALRAEKTATGEISAEGTPAENNSASVSEKNTRGGYLLNNATTAEKIRSKKSVSPADEKAAAAANKTKINQIRQIFSPPLNSGWIYKLTAG